MMQTQGSASQASGKGQRPNSLKISAGDVLAAVQSLYADGVRPCGRILLKRLGERVANGSIDANGASVLALPGGAVPRIDTARLRRTCERHPRLRVETEGSEYCALLLDRPAAFVDASSNLDPYPEWLWQSAAAFFSGPGLHTTYPGGRYACALALVQAQLPFVAGLCLGEVCHFVQLGLSTRQILGYFEGQIVPYSQSEAVLKQSCASLHQPAWALKKDAMPVATLALARDCLKDILSKPQKDGSWALPLPNVKRLFRSQFQLELSETALGHSRLCDLLQDARFGDICAVELRGNTYAVLPVAASQTLAAPAGSPDCDSDACDAASESGESTDVPHSSGSSDVSLEDVVARTFIHFAPAPPTPLPGARQRAASTPRDRGPRGSRAVGPPSPAGLARKARSGSEGACFATFALSALSELRSESASPDLSGGASPRGRFCPDDPLCLEELEEPQHQGFAAPTPSPVPPECVARHWAAAAATPSPQYEHPLALFSTMPGFAAEAPLAAAPVQAAFVAERSTISLFSALEAPACAEPRELAGEKRVRFCADEPLDLSVLDEEAADASCILVTPTPEPLPYQPRQAPTRTAPQESLCATPSPQLPHYPYPVDFQVWLLSSGNA